MILTVEARALIRQLIDALRVPAGLTGNVQFIFNCHGGKIGKITVVVTDTWRP
jgi:hypothetical protein